MTPSEILSQAVPAAQVAEFKAALKLLELELSKGIQIDLTEFMNKPFVLPS